MMPSSELIKILRTGSQGLDYSVRFLILDACDRLERQIRDNELLMNKIVELRSSKGKTNADRIRAMSDEELADAWMKDVAVCHRCVYTEECECDEYVTIEKCKEGLLEWLKQPVEVEG